MRVPSPGDLTAKLPGGTCINILVKRPLIQELKILYWVRSVRISRLAAGDNKSPEDTAQHLWTNS